MNMGILTMYRVVNHGSFWQAYLLWKIFLELGHHVKFIDIIPGQKLFEYPKKITIWKLKTLPNKLIFQPQKHKIFERVQESVLKCSVEPSYFYDYDGIIIGSDEVFHFSQVASWGFSPQLHGAITCDNVSFYTASLGYNSGRVVLCYNLRITV